MSAAAETAVETVEQGQLDEVVYDADLAQRIVDEAEAATFAKTMNEPFAVFLYGHCEISPEARLLALWHLTRAGEQGHTMSHRQAAVRLNRKHGTIRRQTIECVQAGLIDRTNQPGGRALTTPGIWPRNLLDLASTASGDPSHATGSPLPTPREGSVGSRSRTTNPPSPQMDKKPSLPRPPTAASKRRFDKSDFVPSDLDCPKCGIDKVLRNVITSEHNPLCSKCYRTEKANGTVDTWRRGQRPAPPDPALNDAIRQTAHGLVFDEFADERKAMSR